MATVSVTWIDEVRALAERNGWEVTKDEVGELELERGDEMVRIVLKPGDVFGSAWWRETPASPWHHRLLLEGLHAWIVAPAQLVMFG